MSDNALIYARELLNGAAVRAYCTRQSGGDATFDRGVMMAAACIIAADQGGTSSDLIQDAGLRARDIFIGGQDYRREIGLYENLQTRFV